MRRAEIQEALLIAVTYIGTMVGAGFATGQELLQFFAVYGCMGLLSIGIAGLLFIWLGVVMVELGHRIQATGYHELQYFLCGPKLGLIMEICTAVFLFGSLTIMLAGIGCVLRDYLSYSYDFGVLAGAITVGIIVFCGIRGIAAANMICIPILAGCVIALCCHSMINVDISTNLLRMPVDSFPMLGKWPLACFVYVSYNLSLGAVVLGPLGANTKNRQARICGSFLGGLIFAVLAELMVLIIIVHLPILTEVELPLLNIAQAQGGWYPVVYVIILLAAMLTTAIASLFGCIVPLYDRYPAGKSIISFLLLLVAMAISKLGFTKLVMTIYPFFGYIGLIFVVKLIWYALGDIEWH